MDRPRTKGDPIGQLIAFSIALFFNLNLHAIVNQTAKADVSTFLESEKNSIDVFQNTANAIVNVSNLIKIQNFYFMDEAQIETGIGSGFIWDREGHIITNFHIIDGGSSLLIAFKNDKKQYPAKLIGADPISDIAVLKLEENHPSLNPIVLGDSKSLLVGQKVLAIGCPLGLGHSLTTGSISAVNRKLIGQSGLSIEGMIQTDASTNPGSSGGALLDSQGKLIGMSTLFFNAAKAQANTGLSFAIPVDSIKTIVPQLIKYGKIIRPGLGIKFLEDFYAIRIGVFKGVMIKFIDPIGPSAKAGLRGITRNRWGQYSFGDIIIAVDETPIQNNDELFLAIEKYKIGDKVKIKYLRDNKEKTTVVTLAQMEF